jgi:hypothetical protein
VTSARGAAWLFALLTTIYVADGGLAVANGAKPNVWLAVAILEHHALTFAPEEEPFMFNARGAGKYYLTPSALPGRWVGTFGVGAGLTALPLLALVRVVAGPLAAHPLLLWHASKLVAAACVAGAAAFVFLAAAAFTTQRRALAVAAVFAVGSCAWSIASQALYQHGPNMLFVAGGAWALVRRRPLTAGLLLGAASWCRPTSAVVVACAGGWLLWHDRRAAVRFAAPAAALLGLLALYQWHWLGAPWETGQSVRAGAIALVKTGSADPWQTPLWLGAAGLLVSPSRGLFVFSPLFALAFAGAALAFRRAAFATLRPLAVAAGVLMLIAFKWFDWWGGWTYGYRPIVDVTPLLSLLLLPIIDAVFARRWRVALAAALLGWSVAVQLLGVYTYDGDGWNARAGHDIDRPRWRHRLWSLGDSQLVYYATHAAESHRLRREGIDHFVTHPED